MGIDFNNPPVGSDVQKSQQLAREIEAQALKENRTFVVESCNGCPWFYMDTESTQTLCRRSHYENGGFCWYWKHVSNPLGKPPAWCPLDTVKTE